MEQVQVKLEKVVATRVRIAGHIYLCTHRAEQTGTNTETLPREWLVCTRPPFPLHQTKKLGFWTHPL